MASSEIQKQFCKHGHKLSFLPNQKRKRCRECDRIGHSQYYYANRQRINAKNKYRNMFDRYGVTKQIYDQLLSNQNNRCAICNSVSVKRSLSIDHCHKTRIVRGLLCHNCNTILGLAKDNKEIFKKAMEYLTR